MSYHPHRAARIGLDGVAEVAGAAAAIVTDPCLGTASALVLRLHKLEQRPRLPGAPAPPKVPGIGLCSAVGPLRTVLYVKERPWILPLGALALVGGLFGLGYMAGRSRR